MEPPPDAALWSRDMKTAACLYGTAAVRETCLEVLGYPVEMVLYLGEALPVLEALEKKIPGKVPAQ